jgi:O-antigen ligase
MRTQFQSRQSTKWQWGVILLAVVSAGVAGISNLLNISSFAPLIVFGFLIAITAFLIWIKKPVFALYATLFCVFLPIGIIPTIFNSYLNRIMTLVSLGVWLIYELKQRRTVVLSSTIILMGVFLIWSFASLSWADKLSPAAVELQTYTLRLILFLFLITNEIRTKKNLNGLMNIMVLCGWTLILAGVGTILTGGYTPGTRLKILGMNENSVGILTLLTLPCVLWQTVQPSKHFRALKKWLGVIFLISTIVLAALSGSRGSAISLVVTLAAFLFLKPTRQWGKLGLIILVIGVIATPFIFSITLQRFTDDAAGYTVLGGREALWEAAWNLIRVHPWFGVGIGNAPFSIKPYLVLLKSIGSRESVSIHNPLLTVWAETGIPGIVFFLSFLVSAVWSFLRQYLLHRKLGKTDLDLYFALMGSLFVGFMASWIKGGGMETSFAYFLMLAYLIIPASLEITPLENGRVE